MDAVRSFRRGAVHLHILHHAAEHRVHGTWLIEEMARHGHHIGPGTLYPMLHRLEAAGLLKSTGDVANGKVLRVYRATPAGKRALNEMRGALRELAAEVLPGRMAG